MNNELAAQILDPETSLEAYAQCEYYHGFGTEKQWKADVDEACRLGASALRERQEWISVKDRLPEDYIKVLTCDARDNVHIFYHFHQYESPFGIDASDQRYYEVTHWMPLPEPPKDE